MAGKPTMTREEFLEFYDIGHPAPQGFSDRVDFRRKFAADLDALLAAQRDLIDQQAGRIEALERELKRFVEFAKDVRDEVPKGFPEGFEG